MNFLKYFGYELKRSTLRSIIITLICVIIVMAQLPDLIEPTTTSSGKINYIRCRAGIDLLSSVLNIVATALPFLCLADLKSRRNTDALFCLPISRFKLSLTYFVSGIIQLIFIYSCVFFSSFFFLLANTHVFDLSKMLIYYPVSLLAGILIYCYVSFFFSIANTVVDGVIICGLWLIMPSEILHLAPIKYFLGEKAYFIRTYWGSIYSPLDRLSDIFRSKIEINRGLVSEHYFKDYVENLLQTSYMLVFWLALALLCTVGYFIHASKFKANRAGDITDSVFGYKLLIPLVGVVCYRLFSEPIIIVSILTFIMYVIFRRSFKFKKQDYIVWGATVAFNIIRSIGS